MILVGSVVADFEALGAVVRACELGV